MKIQSASYVLDSGKVLSIRSCPGSRFPSAGAASGWVKLSINDVEMAVIPFDILNNESREQIYNRIELEGVFSFVFGVDRKGRINATNSMVSDLIDEISRFA